jgi:hypothetical protein
MKRMQSNELTAMQPGKHTQKISKQMYTGIDCTTIVLNRVRKCPYVSTPSAPPIHPSFACCTPKESCQSFYPTASPTPLPPLYRIKFFSFYHRCVARYTRKQQPGRSLLKLRNQPPHGRTANLIPPLRRFLPSTLSHERTFSTWAAARETQER